MISVVAGVLWPLLLIGLIQFAVVVGVKEIVVVVQERRRTSDETDRPDPDSTDERAAAGEPNRANSG